MRHVGHSGDNFANARQEHKFTRMDCTIKIHSYRILLKFFFINYPLINIFFFFFFKKKRKDNFLFNRTKFSRIKFKAITCVHEIKHY
jgi:hypothetical protein